MRRERGLWRGFVYTLFATCLGIPKGFRHSAQGCESASYLGNGARILFNPEGVEARALHLDNRRMVAPCHNPFRVEEILELHTQGSLARSATLG